MAAEWLRRFRREDELTTGNFRRALAGSYFETGHQQKADELYQSWLDDDPGWGWGWIGWADCYTPHGPGKTQDYARAEEILRRGYAVTGVREAEHVAGRLADICGRTSLPDEAGKFRQQAEKGRQRAGRRVIRATAWTAPTAPASESRAAKQYPAGKTGRNQPCPCGSGKKFKKCCAAPRRHERTGATCALRRPLLNASDMIGGIRGIAIEKSHLSVEVTLRETVELIRQRHSAC